MEKMGIRGSDSGLYDKYGSEAAFRESFIPGIDLPQYEDVYGQMRPSWYDERRMIFIKSQLEMEIGVGEDYKLDEKANGVQQPIPFGVCLRSPGHLTHDEIEIFKFNFDFTSLADGFNE